MFLRFLGLASLVVLASLGLDTVAPAAAPVELPFHFTPGQIEIQVAFGGRPPLTCILDSGSDYSILDAEVAAEMGVHARAQEGLDWADGVDLALGPVALDGLRVRVMRLENFRRQKRAIRCLVGHELFDRYAVTVDYPRQRLVLTAPAAFKPAPGAERLPLTFTGHLPVVAARLDLPHARGVAVTLMVDTGAQSALVLRHPFASRHGLAALAGETRTSGSLVSVTTQFVEIPIENLTLGPFRFPKPRAEAYAQPVGAGGATDTDGLLGNALLTPYRVTFDYAQRALWIEPPRPR